jgi:Flp pilus assembly protein protease CpaA
MLEMYKSIMVLCILTYAAIVDYKTQKVPNKLWLFMLPFALVFFSLELLYQRYFILLVVGVGITIATLYFFYFANFIAASDLKGLMLLALFFPHWHGNITFIWIVICAAIVCTLPLTLYYLYQKYITKDTIQADKARQGPFFPFILLGFILALFITPIG